MARGLIKKFVCKTFRIGWRWLNKALFTGSILDTPENVWAAENRCIFRATMQRSSDRMILSFHSH